ncbi:MAG: hypothetical protein GXO90_05240 [FCB group bacterium]|nr:hypothetical protein [FCB group bacterium]
MRWNSIFVGFFILAAGTSISVRAQDLDCSECHDDVSLKNSIHADLDCSDCHTRILESGLEHAESDKPYRLNETEACGTCHETPAEEYQTSIHGSQLQLDSSNVDVAHCSSCHGSHDILPADDPNSKVYPDNLAGTCGGCHANPDLVKKYNIPDLRPVELFNKSYHAKELGQDGNQKAATCNDCHGIHDIKALTDPTSSISHANISKTCGVCHGEIYALYSTSVHWEALIRGERESPTCVDCHSEHDILNPKDSSSPVNKRNAAEKTCARCHNDEQLIAKYGLLSGKVSSYQDSYHGLALMKGNKNAATCYDCHGIHQILSAQDVRSTINPANLKNTCSHCHPKATDSFSRSYTHQARILAEKPPEYYVRIIYIILIVVVIGGMFVHNLIIFIYYAIQKYREEKTQDYIQRYSRSEIWQHYLLIIAFFTLVISGFSLKYMDNFWVGLFSDIGFTEIGRRIVHRGAAILLIGLSIWHIGEMFFTRHGRQTGRKMLPNVRDLKGFVQLMQNSLHLRKEKPEFDRFDYTEKAEYWALIWGTIVMVLTGFILWFPISFTGIFPSWIVKVAEVFHLYEAWLATLAIIVWHFFYVILHPQEYPLSMTWLHGRMTLDEYRHKHYLDYQQIMAEIKAIQEGTLPLDRSSFQAREYYLRHNRDRMKHA